MFDIERISIVTGLKNVHKKFLSRLLKIDKKTRRIVNTHWLGRINLKEWKNIDVTKLQRCAYPDFFTKFLAKIGIFDPMAGMLDFYDV